MSLLVRGTGVIHQVFGVRDIFTSQELTTVLSGVTCTAAPVACKDAISALAGYNPQNLNATQLALYNSYVPAGAPCLSSLPYPSLGALLAPPPRMCMKIIILCGSYSADLGDVPLPDSPA